MNDSVVLLLALDAREKGLLDHAALATHAKKLVQTSQLYGSQWLLAYEAIKHGWVSREKDVIDADPIFSILDQHDVIFYEAEDLQAYKVMMKGRQPYNPYSATAEEFEDDLPF